MRRQQKYLELDHPGTHERKFTQPLPSFIGAAGFDDHDGFVHVGRPK